VLTTLRRASRRVTVLPPERSRDQATAHHG
jgi:hypothetical protein